MSNTCPFHLGVWQCSCSSTAEPQEDLFYLHEAATRLWIRRNAGIWNGITWPLDCLEGFIQMRHEGLGYEVHDHTQVHKDTSRKPMDHGRETGRRTLTIPFFVGKSFFFFFFNPWDTCGCIFGQPSNLVFTSPISLMLLSIYMIFHLCVCVCVCVCVCGGLSIFFFLCSGEMKRSL